MFEANECNGYYSNEYNGYYSNGILDLPILCISKGIRVYMRQFINSILIYA